MKRLVAAGFTGFAALALATPASADPPALPGCQGLATAVAHGADAAPTCLTVDPTMPEPASSGLRINGEPTEPGVPGAVTTAGVLSLLR